MNEFPRLALATSAEEGEPSVACLSMLAGLTQRRLRVQHFRTRACPTATEAVGQVTGLPGRHLDAWLMPPEVCRELFTRASRSAELSLVEGTLDEPKSSVSYTSCDFPGDLRPIVQALDLPVVAVVKCRAGVSESLHLPRLPEGIDAVLLDELSDRAALPGLKRLFGLGARLPVIGAIELAPLARAALEKAPRDRMLPEELISALAEAFWKHADLEAINGLARSRPFPRAGKPVALAAADAAAGFGWATRTTRRSADIFRTRWKRSKPSGPSSSSFHRFVTSGFQTVSTW